MEVQTQGASAGEADIDADGSLSIVEIANSAEPLLAVLFDEPLRSLADRDDNGALSPQEVLAAAPAGAFAAADADLDGAVAAAELTAATESTDLLAVAELLGKYRTGYPDEIKTELKALTHRRDELIMDVQAKVSGRVAESEDPAELLEIIEESRGYGEAAQVQLADANA